MSISMNSEVAKRLNELLEQVESHVDADVLSLVGPITYGVERKVMDAVEALPQRRKRIAIILHTGGGVVEVAERMVTVIRHHYDDVTFIVPDLAMSAGTVFVMSGDTIMMDYSSCLGPIDPQVVRDGKLVPALSYLAQYDRLIAKAAEGKLTDPEFAILSQFDQAELHQFEMARNLSLSLLKQWLARYKFKDWAETETRGELVTSEMREVRAQEVGRATNAARPLAVAR